MKDKKKTLYLYEALELRSEYDARIKTLKDCLPESKQNRDRFSFTRDDGMRRPSPDFDVASARKDLRKDRNQAAETQQFYSAGKLQPFHQL
jgi:hypothetical protein